MTSKREPSWLLPGCPQCSTPVTGVGYGGREVAMPLTMRAPARLYAIDPLVYTLQPCGHSVGGYLVAVDGVKSWLPVTDTV